MKKTKKFRFILAIAALTCCIVSVFFQTSEVHADEAKEYSLNIVKYRLSEEDLGKIQFPSGAPLKEEDAKDTKGEALKTMAGVHYQVTRVMATNDNKSPFKAEPGFKPIDVVTDGSGAVSVSLPEGTYQVRELASESLKNVADPVIVPLPFIEDNGTVLSNVYIYPKSSIINTPGNPEAPKKTPTRTNIPQTGGDLGSLIPVLFMLGMVITFGMISIFGIKPRA